MKKNPKNPRRDNYFAYKENNRLPSNRYDLSHDVKTTFKMGWLTPHMCIETLPSDNFVKIQSEVMIRFAPLVLPLMHKVDVTTYFFYVPNRLLWPDWGDFIQQKETLEAPKVAFPLNTNIQADWILTYLGLPSFPTTNTDADVWFSPMPLAAYAIIWDEYFRNEHVQTEKFVVLTAGDNSTNYATMMEQEPFWRNWGPDYFTKATPEPTEQSVLMPLVSQIPDASDANSIYGPREWVSNTGGAPNTGAASFIGTYLTAGGSANRLDIQSTAGTIAELRYAARLQEWFDRVNRTGDRYREFMKGFFGVDPHPGTIDIPEYIGSSVGTVQVSEVMQTVESATDPLGNYAGQALALTTSDSFNHFCPEHGFIIGLINVQPRASYWKGLNKMWSRTDPLDYWFEEFEGIGDQPIKNKEIYMKWNSTTTNDNDFAYIPRYAEYKFQNDIISGNMRDTFTDFHLGRDIASSVHDNFNGTFLECEPRADDVFVLPTANDHECYAHIYNHVIAKRPLRRFVVPTL